MSSNMDIIDGMSQGDIYKFKFASKDEANIFAADANERASKSNKVLGFYFGSGGSFRLIFYVMVERML